MTTTSTALATTTTSASRAYSEEALSYFAEVALGSEFGSDFQVIRKWTADVRITVQGTPTDTDMATLSDVVADLNDIIDPIEIEIVDSTGNVDLHFGPESEFETIEPNYVPVNLGFFWVWFDDTDSISNAHILISTTGVTQVERNHLIREELTQSLGLMNDSFTYEDSMFFQEWTETAAYSALDELLIEMLYQPEISSGMGFEEALELLGTTVVSSSSTGV